MCGAGQGPGQQAFPGGVWGTGGLSAGEEHGIHISNPRVFEPFTQRPSEVDSDIQMQLPSLTGNQSTVRATPETGSLTRKGTSQVPK